MKAYVIYVLADYACAVGITTNKNTAEQYKTILLKRGCNAWIDEILITNALTELECD